MHKRLAKTPPALIVFAQYHILSLRTPRLSRIKAQ